MGSVEENVVLPGSAACPLPSQPCTPGQVVGTVRGVLLGVMELQGFS